MWPGGTTKEEAQEAGDAIVVDSPGPCLQLPLDFGVHAVDVVAGDAEEAAAAAWLFFFGVFWGEPVAAVAAAGGGLALALAATARLAICPANSWSLVAGSSTAGGGGSSSSAPVQMSSPRTSIRRHCAGRRRRSIGRAHGTETETTEGAALPTDAAAGAAAAEAIRPVGLAGEATGTGEIARWVGGRRPASAG